MPSARNIRRTLGLSATAAALASAAVLATAGSAQTPPSTLHLLSTNQRSVGFAPHGAPRPGARLGFGDKITGDDTGYDRGVCTFIGGKSLLCTVQVQLAKGTLSVQGMLSQRASNTPMAITGGTGAYDGARGTALVTDVSKTQTKIDVNLLP
jgi:hypothetical protein